MRKIFMYSKVVEVSTQAMLQCMPLKPNKKSIHTSTNPQVEEAMQRESRWSPCQMRHSQLR